MAETPLSTPDPTFPSTATAEAGGETRAQGRSPAEVLRASRERAFQEARTKVREAAEAQRQRAAEAVGGVAGALHRAANDLNAENQTMGRYTDMAAERLDEVADYLRSTNWGSVMEGAEDFARRQPAWFIGGALATGFLIARAVKNSGQTRQRDTVSTLSRGMAATSAAGYGTSTEAGVEPPGPATTRPISSSTIPPYPTGEG